MNERKRLRFVVDLFLTEQRTAHYTMHMLDLFAHELIMASRHPTWISESYGERTVDDLYNYYYMTTHESIVSLQRHYLALCATTCAYTENEHLRKYYDPNRQKAHDFSRGMNAVYQSKIHNYLWYAHNI